MTHKKRSKKKIGEYDERETKQIAHVARSTRSVSLRTFRAELESERAKRTRTSAAISHRTSARFAVRDSASHEAACEREANRILASARANESQRFIVMTQHGEGATVFHIVDSDAPDSEQPAIIKSRKNDREQLDREALALCEVFLHRDEKLAQIREKYARDQNVARQLADKNEKQLQSIDVGSPECTEIESFIGAMLAERELDRSADVEIGDYLVALSLPDDRAEQEKQIDALLICAQVEHAWHVESIVSEDSASEDFECTRCGFSPETIIYY